MLVYIDRPCSLVEVYLKIYVVAIVEGNCNIDLNGLFNR